MASLDELVNKAKRANLEDMYRGVELLTEHEVVALRGILATANKKASAHEGRGPVRCRSPACTRRLVCELLLLLGSACSTAVYWEHCTTDEEACCRSIGCVLVCILLLHPSSFSPQVLPTEGMNLNQLNLKQALWAAVAAHEYVVDKVALRPPPLTGGLGPLRDKGLSARQLSDLGEQRLGASAATTTVPSSVPRGNAALAVCTSRNPARG